MQDRSLGEWEEEDKLRMKAASVTMVTLLLMSALVLVFNIQTVKTAPVTLIVPDDYPTIQQAITAANPGDTIYVRAGTYYESIIVNKNNLTLVGESKDNTVIDGSGIGTVIEVRTNNVVISRFTVQNGNRSSGTSYAGIKISGRVCSITGNLVTKNKIGIFVTSQKSRITENVVKNNGQGIALYASSDVTVEANNVSANTVGISLALSFNNMIVGNRVLNSTAGGHGITLSSNSFNNTIFKNALMNNYHGIWLSGGSSDNWIVENTIANNELLGIELAGSSNNTFYHNDIVNNPTPVRVDTGKPNESICIWDDGYPSGGNYWNDYTDVDEKSGPNQDQPGSDGIWDNPYVIDENNKDRYPSVKPYGEIPDLILDKTKPTANAGPDQTVNVGTPVTFDASGSTDNVGIVSYEWDFGDGTTKTGMTPAHTYTEPGIHTVTLTVKDAAGNSDTDSIIVTVVETPSDGEGQASPDSSPWINWVAPAIIGIAIAIMLFGRHRKYRRRRRSKRK